MATRRVNAKKFQIMVFRVRLKTQAIGQTYMKVNHLCKIKSLLINLTWGQIIKEKQSNTYRRCMLTSKGKSGEAIIPCMHLFWVWESTELTHPCNEHANFTKTGMIWSYSTHSSKRLYAKGRRKKKRKNMWDEDTTKVSSGAALIWVWFVYQNKIK